MPEISVIIPTFNRADMLRTAIKSVVAQRGVDLEIVVSDNCSSDHTHEVIEEFSGLAQFRYFRQSENVGMVNNWKRAIFRLAQAEWFVLMSDDDYFTDADYLRRSLDAIRKYDPAFVYAGGIVDDASKGTQEVLHLPFSGLVDGTDVFASRGTVKPQDMILCNILFRVEDAARLGFLSNPDNLSCDSELFLNLCLEGSVFVDNRSVCVYKKHGGNLVDTIRTSARRLVANLDHLINPYLHAKRTGTPDKVISEFRKNATLDKSISSTLLRLQLHRNFRYEPCRAHLNECVPELLQAVESSVLHRMKRAVLDGSSSYFRNRYPLND